MTKAKITEVQEHDYGVYVWMMPDGSVVGDDEGNFLSIESARGDLRRIAALTKAVRGFGVEKGEAKFLQGRRKVTQSEYEDQMERMQDGKTPDWYDTGGLPGQV